MFGGALIRSAHDRFRQIAFYQLELLTKLRRDGPAERLGSFAVCAIAHYQPRAIPRQQRDHRSAQATAPAGHGNDAVGQRPLGKLVAELAESRGQLFIPIGRRHDLLAGMDSSPGVTPIPRRARSQHMQGEG